MESVVKSFNIFVDTDRGTHTGTCTADDFELNLNRVNIDADKGQFLRLSVQNFSMSKNWTNVNKYNNKFRLVGIFSSGAIQNFNHPVVLDQNDYEDRNQLANEVAIKVIATLDGFLDAIQNLGTGALVANSVAPAATGNATNKRISFGITMPSGHNLSELHLLFPTTYSDNSISDAYQLLGGIRGKDHYEP